LMSANLILDTTTGSFEYASKAIKMKNNTNKVKKDLLETRIFSNYYNRSLSNSSE